MEIPTKLYFTIKEIIEGQIRESITYDKYSEFSKYIYDQLILYSNNSNCLYHLGLLIQYHHPEIGLQWEDGMQYIAKAAEHGHPTAMYYLGLVKYEKVASNKYEIIQKRIDLDEAIQEGIKAFVIGYGSNLDLNDRTSNEYDYDSRYKNECMIRAIQQLRERITVLENTVTTVKEENTKLMTALELERLRPPEIGGSDYEEIKTHFESIQK